MVSDIRIAHNDLEAWTRKASIRISGLPLNVPPDSKYENSIQVCLDFFRIKLKVTLKEDDICIAHRLPRKWVDRNKDNPPIMLCKFVRLETKSVILRNRSLLKVPNEKAWFQEDITQTNGKLLHALKQTAGTAVDKAWAINGKVFASVGGKVSVVKPNNIEAVLASTPNKSFGEAVSNGTEPDLEPKSTEDSSTGLIG